MIKTVVRSRNNMVMVFNRRGEQVPKYQGQYEEVRKNILADAPPDAVFAHGFAGSGKLLKVPREEW